MSAYERLEDSSPTYERIAVTDIEQELGATTMIYRVCHRDRQANETIEIKRFSDFEQAKGFVITHYRDRLRADGRNRVDILDDNDLIVATYAVG